MRFATDTGGTFTDLVVEDDDGVITMYKSATVPEDPVQGVFGALSLAAEDRGLTLSQLLARGGLFIHGTTHAINAIITGRTAKTAFLVTEGHPDILVFREGGRLEPFNHQVDFPRPYVPRALTWEIPERILSDGTILKPLDKRKVEEIAIQLKAKEIDAIAVCLLWATINPEHEIRIAEILHNQLPGVPISLSHIVNPTLREFRRASATAIDASLKPIMSRYIGGLTQRLHAAGYEGDVMVLTSSGGLMAAEDVADHPVRVINSGPSMAPIAGSHYTSQEFGPRDVIVADTGGTTYDISLVRGGNIPMTRELWIGEKIRGHLIGYPSVDVKSIGAGGGSIASVDSGGLLRVGPQSAGSKPGPVCYQRGGVLPTVTDAAVVLGYVDPDFFLGGTMKLDLEGARSAIQTHIAEKLAVPVEEAAWNVLQLATQNMVQAIEDITVTQGIDPARSVLVGGGGAAGLNSTFIARRLGVDTLIIPETGAALSAAGALMSDLVGEYSASLFLTTASFDYAKAEKTISSLVERCYDFVARSGGGPVTSHIRVTAEARYENQVWDIDVPVAHNRLGTSLEVDAFRRTFDTTHEEIFTISDSASDVEIVGLRASVRCRLREKPDFRLSPISPDVSRANVRQAYFSESGWTDTQILSPERLAIDESYAGPAILETNFTTIVVDPSATFRITASGSLIITP